MRDGLEEFLKRIEEKPTNETLIDRFMTLVMEEDSFHRVFYLSKLVALLLNSNPYYALRAAALELQEARKGSSTKDNELSALRDVEASFLKLGKTENANLIRDEIDKLLIEMERLRAAAPSRKTEIRLPARPNSTQVSRPLDIPPPAMQPGAAQLKTPEFENPPDESEGIIKKTTHVPRIPLAKEQGESGAKKRTLIAESGDLENNLFYTPHRREEVEAPSPSETPLARRMPPAKENPPIEEAREEGDELSEEPDKDDLFPLKNDGQAEFETSEDTRVLPDDKLPSAVADDLESTIPPSVEFVQIPAPLHPAKEAMFLAELNDDAKTDDGDLSQKNREFGEEPDTESPAKSRVDAALDITQHSRALPRLDYLSEEPPSKASHQMEAFASRSGIPGDFKSSHREEAETFTGDDKESLQTVVPLRMSPSKWTSHGNQDARSFPPENEQSIIENRAPVRAQDFLPANLLVTHPGELRWDLFQERLLRLSDAMRSPAKIEGFLKNLYRRDEESIAKHRAKVRIQEFLAQPQDASVRWALLEWVFEQLDTEEMHRLWLELQMQREGAQFFSAFLSRQMEQFAYRRTIGIIKDALKLELDLAWFELSYPFLKMGWERLNLVPWYWTPTDGPQAFMDKLAKREDLLPAAILVAKAL